MSKKKLEKRLKEATEILEAVQFNRDVREAYKASIGALGCAMRIPPPRYDVSIESFVEWDRAIERWMAQVAKDVVSAKQQ